VLDYRALDNVAALQFDAVHSVFSYRTTLLLVAREVRISRLAATRQLLRSGPLLAMITAVYPETSFSSSATPQETIWVNLSPRQQQRL